MIPTFGDLWLKLSEHTLLSESRMARLYAVAAQAPAGAFVEVGVGPGGSGAMLAAIARETNRPVWLCDTFAGFAEVTPADAALGHGPGIHAYPRGCLASALADVGDPVAEVFEGVFPASVAGRASGPVALVHCDVDVYRATLDVVTWALAHLVPGGVLVCDDYGAFAPARDAYVAAKVPFPTVVYPDGQSVAWAK
jgi:predicted O-methyltransferase YrrM